jgi:hypothetical protein
MGKAKKTRKFAVTKRMISPKDTRVRENAEKAKAKEAELKKKEEPRQVEQAVSALFFQYNTQLGPPYHILVDTNFINFSIRKKLDMVRSMMDCLLAKCTPCITDWYVVWNDRIQQCCGACHNDKFFGLAYSTDLLQCNGGVGKARRKVQDCVATGQRPTV